MTGEHITDALHATGECPYSCPVCAAITLIKNVKPEAAAHLASAAQELLLALKVMVEPGPGYAKSSENGSSR